MAADGLQIALSDTYQGLISARQSALLHRDRADLASYAEPVMNDGALTGANPVLGSNEQGR
jgi:hypothetical protein